MSELPSPAGHVARCGTDFVNTEANYLSLRRSRGDCGNLARVSDGSSRLIAGMALALGACFATTVFGSPSPLAAAIEKQDHATSRALIRDTDVNAAQADGMTALHWAVYQDDLDTAKLLLTAGANAKAANRYGVTPLSLACTNGNAALVDLLLAGGANPNAALQGGETPLMTAARTGKLAPVKALLAHGADVNARLPGGQTALMWSAAEGHADVVEALLA